MNVLFHIVLGFDIEKLFHVTGTVYFKVLIPFEVEFIAGTKKPSLVTERVQ